MIIELIVPTGKFRVFKRSRYRLKEDLFVDGTRIPSGTVSDGASLPFFVRTFLDPMGIWAEAAFLHDYLYNRINRKDAAKRFKAAMRASGTPEYICQAFYLAVRFADLTYKKK